MSYSSRLPVTRTLNNLNLPLTPSYFHFPSGCFLTTHGELFSISLEGSNYRETNVLEELRWLVATRFFLVNYMPILHAHYGDKN